MKLNNILLIVLIGIILFQGSKKDSVKTVNTIKRQNAISIKPIPIEQYKTIVPIVDEKKNTKHSTTFRSYFDSDNRSTIGVSHNIRIGKDYYVSGGVTSRQSSYGGQDLGVNLSLTKYW